MGINMDNKYYVGLKIDNYYAVHILEDGYEDKVLVHENDIGGFLQCLEFLGYSGK